MQAVAEDATTVIVHYQETEDNDKDWNLWIWPAGGEGSAYDFTEEDNFGKVATITLPGKIDEVGFIVRTDSWEKDVSSDRFITEFNNGVGEIWVYGGVEEFYYENPEGADEITYESVKLDINYNNYDEVYDGLMAHIHFLESEGQTISFDEITEFGAKTSLTVENTLGQSKLIVDILKDDQVIATYDVKKVKEETEIFLVENNERTFYSIADAVYKPQINTAKLFDTMSIEIETNMPFKADVKSLRLMVNGVVRPVASILSDDINGFLSPKTIIKLAEPVAYSDEIEIIVPKFEPVGVQLGDVYDTLEFNTAYNYDGVLGPIYSQDSTTFKVWAPTATEIKLSLFEDHKSDPTETLEMDRSDKGVWSVTVEGDLHNRLYAYEVTHGNMTEYVVDPYARAVSVNGIRSAVVDLEATNPEGWDTNYKPNFGPINDAVMYELHVRDLSMHGQAGIENRGLFLGLTELGTKTNNGFSTGLSYIKELGVTHIQLLPIYDYGSIDEAKDDYAFNWGYDPVNYNALEGSYSSDPFTPDVRIKEFKQAVQTIHNEDLHVTMDVVYNHVYSLNAMAFEKLVPGYYFRKEGENYANGSGCGNETASERFMMRKFMVDSVTYLADEYKLDGFRFDLMGLHDVETMNAIRSALNEIDPSITIIGEGWNMGIVLPEENKANQNQAHEMPGIAHFNDTIRDGLKGSVFDEMDQGFVNGKLGMEARVFSGIIGGIQYEDYSTWGDIEPNQAVTYVEAHDNHTLYDKLKISNPDATPQEIKQMHTMADTIILTSQGVPFVHAGQEFMRTKLGDHNSYKSSDIVNRLDWARREKHDDLVSYFKGLIEMRKNHPSFRMLTKEEIVSKLNPIKLDEQMIVYEIINEDDTWAHILVAFNASADPMSLELPKAGTWTIVASQGQVNEEGLSTVQDKLQINALDSVVMYLSENQVTNRESTQDSEPFNYTWLIIITLIVIIVGVIVKKRL